MATHTQEVTQSKHKRKPVRRDPERRRQQNIQAQKKYRECSLSLAPFAPAEVDAGRCFHSLAKMYDKLSGTSGSVANFILRSGESGDPGMDI